eukprot:3433995-Pyramimonas_sp.AAC.1
MVVPGSSWQSGGTGGEGRSEMGSLTLLPRARCGNPRPSPSAGSLGRQTSRQPPRHTQNHFGGPV